MPDGSPGVGHNSAADKGIAAKQLTAFVERIERVEVDISNAQTDRKEIYQELKGAGFDPKIVRKLIGLRKMDPAERQEQEALLDVYRDAVGV